MTIQRTPMTTSGLSKDTTGKVRLALKRVLTVAIVIFGPIGVGTLLGVRLNLSESLPLGLYVVTRSTNANLVEFCPDGQAAQLSRERDYRHVGTCPDGRTPLLKPVVARAGDFVEVSSHGIAVNGRLLPNTAPKRCDSRGRPLRAWPLGTYTVPSGYVWVASAYNPASFDSRYYGPIALALVRHSLRPLWTFSH